MVEKSEDSNDKDDQENNKLVGNSTRLKEKECITKGEQWTSL